MASVSVWSASVTTVTCFSNGPGRPSEWYATTISAPAPGAMAPVGYSGVVQPQDGRTSTRRTGRSPVFVKPNAVVATAPSSIRAKS